MRKKLQKVSITYKLHSKNIHIRLRRMLQLHKLELD